METKQKNIMILALSLLFVFGMSGVVNAVPIEACITADNHYALYYGSEDGMSITFVGRNELGAEGIPSSGLYNWSEAENWSFDMTGDYIYIAAWSDDEWAQGLLGQFVTPDPPTILTNTDWEVCLTWINLDNDSDAPTESDMSTQIAIANANDFWYQVPYYIDHGSGLWGPEPIVGIDSLADWIWGSPLEDDFGYGEYQIFRKRVTPKADADGPYLVAVGETISLNSSYSYNPDWDPIDSYSWIHADGYGTVVGSEFTGVSPGIGSITLTVTDKYGHSDTDTAIVVVYDPSAGFVTGGGWIWSEPGAYKKDITLEGRANFGFVSKYKKGATIPTGNTEFIFHAGDLNFHSNSYDWLVVNQGGTNAQFKGTGTINGFGEHKFMLRAGDGETDTFGIRIWTEDDGGVETDVYDSGFDQPIMAGSIVIHTKYTKSK